MPLYMYQAAYTPESLAAQIREPRDRLEVVRPAIEAAGARLVVGGYSFGDYDVVALYEAPDDREVGTVPEYFRFLERWDRYRVTLLSFMRSRDLLLCPVEAFPAPVQDAKHPGYRRLPPRFTYTTPFSLVGWPCAVVRAGASPEGLPIGVQVVGGPWRDDVALAAARQIEAAQGGWKRPAL